ncbi:hypothetical protein ABZ313_40385 [Streptomyces sp. NPDC006251]|uniref:hypothetical protein n=1 Tax=Streptomyces sp. NPDC006251 TaxID=3155718 RepID=UPI0033A85F01
MSMATGLILAVAACHGGESNDGNSASTTSDKGLCENVLSAQGEEAVRRVAGIPDSVKMRFSGHAKDSADELVSHYDSGAPGEAHNLDFCRVYRGSSEVMPSVQVEFSLVQEVEKREESAIGKDYRMGVLARASTKLGVLYFECSSKRFNSGAGATVLVRGESRSNDEVSESEKAAQEDNLRIIYESSRAFSDLLDCKSNAGLPADFKMPPEL